jgi:peptidoglycan/xylan/chitin deacetylase (PgdA/CDA1 family)
MLAATVGLNHVFGEREPERVGPDGRPAVGPHLSTRSPAVPAALTRQLAAARPVGARAAPLLLAYHEVSPRSDDPFGIKPAVLAAHMELLARAGYRTIRSADLVAWLGGRALPPKSVYLSFDGREGVWRYADAILARHRFTASVFVPSGRLERAEGYLTWTEVRKLADTGRWDVEAHSHAGHEFVPTGPASPPGAALVHRRWLPAERRLETVPEYAARVEADLSACIADLQRRGHRKPAVFAFPYSESQPADPRTARALTAATRKLFPVTLLDDERGRPTIPAELANRRLRRVDGVGILPLPAFVARLRTAATPINPAGPAPAHPATKPASAGKPGSPAAGRRAGSGPA